MELKSYQHKVIQDLERYLEYIQQHKKTSVAFNQFWEDRIGPYNPVSGEGMQSYKNTIPHAVHVCIKVPTAGGKTFIACNALHTIFNAYSPELPKVVVWLVPWSNLLDQTVSSLSNPDHPYRQKLNSLFNHRVEVYQKKDLLQGSNFNSTVVKDQLSILVMSFSSLRAKNKEDRKAFQENGQLASFADQYSDRTHVLDDTDETALINVIRSLNPVLVVDESHNAESDLSVEMLKALNPSFVLDLTATPKNNSNIISLVPAIELKKEHMVKLPVIVYNHHDKTEVINSALHLQHRLELLAIEQEKKGGKYIRPIVLFQAQAKTAEDNTTFEKLKEQLLAVGIPAEQIKIKTANKDEIKGIDLSSKDCPVRYIITINALKEGWDCPFAYVLASLADKSSAVDVEQILGRVLRQPYAMQHAASLLNNSYVLTASSKFNETLQSVVNGLQASGFSERDYRQKDATIEEKKQVFEKQVVNSLFYEQEEAEIATEEEEIDANRISFWSEAATVMSGHAIAVSEIEKIAEEQNREMEHIIKKQSQQAADENIFQEMGEKVKHYRIVDTHKELATTIILPQFYLEVPKSDIFDTDQQFLDQESLLKNFRLSKQNASINFEQAACDITKVDLEETKKDDYAVRIRKADDQFVTERMIEYILAKPKESQIREIVHKLVKEIGDIRSIADKEIRIYIEHVLNGLSATELQDVLVRTPHYATKIKSKIRQHIDVYAEEQFNDLIKIGKTAVVPTWKFKSMIVPGPLGAAIGNSLYEREGAMNNFETTVITDIASLPNIAFWHRNLGRGEKKGFAINGFKSNHYPDFIVVSKSGKVIVIETKGDDRDNSDSIAKCRLGNTWAELAGKPFFYFMVFDKNVIDGAFTVDKAKALIKQL